jgi:hypothetical protein
MIGSAGRVRGVWSSCRSLKPRLGSDKGRGRDWPCVGAAYDTAPVTSSILPISQPSLPPW